MISSSSRFLLQAAHYQEGYIWHLIRKIFWLAGESNLRLLIMNPGYKHWSMRATKATYPQVVLELLRKCYRPPQKRAGLS